MRDRRLLLLLLGRCRAKDVWFSWPQVCWSEWSLKNLIPGCPEYHSVLHNRQQQRVYTRLFEEAWALQTMLGGHIHAENPVTSHGERFP